MKSLVIFLSVVVSLTYAKQIFDLKDAKFVRKGQSQDDPNVMVKRQASCSASQFACTYTCIPASYQCDFIYDCPTGEDEQNCASSCTGANQFACANGHCVPASYQCDHDNDCGDASDEINCGFTCNADHFTCANGACVSDMWVCDGDNDCGDHSDENDCASRSCRPDQFTCTSHKCIPASYQCDHDDDCGDQSDETGCTCGVGHFQCPNGGCISERYLCDGDNDCGDMSDEEDCPEFHPGVCADKMTYEDCVRMNTATFPICDYYADAHVYCRKYCGLCNT